MSWRSIIAYYIFFAFLGGYYLLFEAQPRRQEVAQPQPPGERRPFLNLTQDSIEELVIRRLEGEVVCQREGSGWKVIKPTSARQIAPGLILSLVDNLVQSREAEVMAESAADLSPFGLDLPHSTLVIKLNNQSTPVTLFLGERNPPGTAVYARLEGSPRIFLLGLTLKYYEELLFDTVRAGKKG